MRERKLQRALLFVASSLLHATNEKTVYLPSHSHANYQTRPVPHADQVVPCMCCTVYSQLTCPLSNPDNLFGIGLLKDNGKTHDIKWRVVQKAKAYSNITKRCSPCLEEKARRITADRRSSLNKRSEVISKCRHQNKFMLSTPIT